jgi:hypothetical protein
VAHDDDLVPLLPALLQALAHQCRADALVLELRQGRHWCQGQRRDCAGLGDDGQVTEEDVADDLAGLFSDQRHPQIAPVPQGIYQPGLVILSEGEAVDFPNGVQVSGGFGADQDAHAFLPLRSCSATTSRHSPTRIGSEKSGNTHEAPSSTSRPAL